MTTVNPLHSAQAVAINPARTTHTAHAPDAVQLHAHVENALTMALYYMRQPTSNLPGASRKAVQALDAMNRLKAAGFALAANDNVRAEQ